MPGGSKVSRQSSASVYAGAFCYHENPRKTIEIFYRARDASTARQDENSHRDRVKQLLAETEHALERIAALAGFDHPEYMSVAFKRETGKTPGTFRQLAQLQQTGRW